MIRAEYRDHLHRQRSVSGIMYTGFDEQVVVVGWAVPTSLFRTFLISNRWAQPTLRQVWQCRIHRRALGIMYAGRLDFVWAAVPA